MIEIMEDKKEGKEEGKRRDRRGQDKKYEGKRKEAGDEGIVDER